MSKKSTISRPLSLIKTGVLLFLMFHFVKAFFPPALYDLNIQTANEITLQQLLTNVEAFVDQPVVIDEVRVKNPCYLYFGSFYYIESPDSKSSILVLSRKYPPKAGSTIRILGGIQPVFSLKGVHMAFFKHADLELISSV